MVTTALVGLSAAENLHHCEENFPSSYCATKLPPDSNGLVYYRAKRADVVRDLVRTFSCDGKGEEGKYCCHRPIAYTFGTKFLVISDEFEHGQESEFPDKTQCKPATF